MRVFVCVCVWICMCVSVGGGEKGGIWSMERKNRYARQTLSIPHIHCLYWPLSHKQAWHVSCSIVWSRLCFQLEESLLMFPGLLMTLLDKCGISPDKRVTAHPFFGPSAQARYRDSVHFSKWERMCVCAHMYTRCVYGSQDSLLVRVPDLWLKGCEFKFQQEWQENFLLQSQLCVLTLILVYVPSPCYCSGM